MANALVIYCYEGNKFTDFGGDVTGFYTTDDYVQVKLYLRQPIGPNFSGELFDPDEVDYFYISDGHQQGYGLLNWSGSYDTEVWVETDENGDITQWDIHNQGGVTDFECEPCNINTSNDDIKVRDSARTFVLPGYDFTAASVWDNPGTWKVVPEPSTMLLLGSGLVGLGVLGRKRFKK